MLQLGINHPAFRRDIVTTLFDFLQNCSRIAGTAVDAGQGGNGGNGHAGKDRSIWSVIMLVATLLGFLQAFKDGAGFWTPEEQLNILTITQAMLSERFLLAVEAACSAVRNARVSNPAFRDLKGFLRHYDTAGRPLGALPLQDAFARFTESCASRMVVSDQMLRGQNVLSVLMSGFTHTSMRRQHTPLTVKIAEISVQGLANADEGSDYISLTSDWQQLRAQGMKASYLISYLCCSISDEDIADPDLLSSWLQQVLESRTQAADDTLNCTSMQCLALLARTSDTTASSLSRTLPRYLTHRPMSANVAFTTAEALLYVLKLLPQDTVITTLWGLGNSLSAGPEEGQAKYALFTDGAEDDDTEGLNGHVEPGVSSGSLASQSEPNNEIRNHGTVIIAIVTIAHGFRDPKITALALSMLIQKVSKVSPEVDLAIITETASLGTIGGVQEFRALLRLYSRLIHEGVLQNNEAILIAVSTKH